MPPLIRRRPWSERLKEHLDPYDFLLWLSEEFHDSAWDEALQDWALLIGAGANLVFIIARANSGLSSSGRRDDVFGDFDGRGGSGWFAWLSSFTAHLLALLSILNAVYTFTRSRHYRLFESSIDETPSTPSARRVKVNDSPASSSPLRYLSSAIRSTAAQSRAHPDQHRDVWELRVWDPKELNLELFTFFSPGHVLVYWLFLPTTSLDPRPSVTVVTSILISALLSLQLGALRKFFTQQAKDNRIINKEVLHEYDTKYVHPTINRPVRNVATQTKESATSPRAKTREVDLYTPTTLINRGFRVNPNPKYSGHLGEDSDGPIDSPTVARAAASTRPLLRTPSSRPSTSHTSFGTQPDRTNDFASPVRQQQPVSHHQNQHRPPSPTKGDGGSLGVYSHAASPLKKAASHSSLRPASRGDVSQIPARTGSPLKRMSTPGDGGRDRLGQSSRIGNGTDRDRLTHRFSNLRDQRRDTGGF